MVVEAVAEVDNPAALGDRKAVDIRLVVDSLAVKRKTNKNITFETSNPRVSKKQGHSLHHIVEQTFF